MWNFAFPLRIRDVDSGPWPAIRQWAAAARSSWRPGRPHFPLLLKEAARQARGRALQIWTSRCAAEQAGSTLHENMTKMTLETHVSSVSARLISSPAKYSPALSEIYNPWSRPRGLWPKRIPSFRFQRAEKGHLRKSYKRAPRPDWQIAFFFPPFLSPQNRKHSTTQKRVFLFFFFFFFYYKVKLLFLGTPL